MLSRDNFFFAETKADEYFSGQSQMNERTAERAKKAATKKRGKTLCGTR